MGRSCINYVTDNENFQYARKDSEIILDELTKLYSDGTCDI